MADEHSDAAWRALVSAALMGTERVPFTPPMAAGELGAALAALDPQNAERALLDSAAILATYRRAGALPAHGDGASPSACAGESLPAAGERAANALETVLRGSAPHALVAEWCALAAQAGVRIPDEHLPAILNLFSHAPGPYDVVLDSIGPRGRWLAGHNPAWRLLALEPGTEGDAWATGNRATRLSALKSARRRDPALARALLESTWKTESADDRARFIAELGRGLSLADEPFLENALDDRAKGVREAAVVLLMRLAGSRLVGRMIERVKPLFSYDAASERLQVELPDTFDAGMQRDGVDFKPRSAGTGDKTWWFHRMLRCIPPHIWTEAFDTTPDALIDAAKRSIWMLPLFDSWTEAALFHADEHWLKRLPDERFKNPLYGKLAAECLPDDVLESLITRLIQFDSSLWTDHPICIILMFKSLLFTRTQTRHALARLRQTSEEVKADQAGSVVLTDLRTNVAQVLSLLHPSAVAEAEEALGVQDGDFSQWGTVVRDALHVLYQRREIHAAFGKL